MSFTESGLEPADRPARTNPSRPTSDGHHVDGHHLDGHHLDGHHLDGHHLDGAAERPDGVWDRDPVSNPMWREHAEKLGADDLRRLSATLPVIEQAKGVLMGYYGCDAAAAFDFLARWSSTRNLKVRVVAAAVVAAASRPSTKPFAELREYLRSNLPGPVRHRAGPG